MVMFQLSLHIAKIFPDSWSNQWVYMLFMQYIDTCGLEHLAKTPTRRCGGLFTETQYPGHSYFRVDALMARPVVHFVVVTVMIQSPWVPRFFLSPNT